MRYAVCNELFVSMPLEASCKLAAEYGFKGLELAPYTLADNPRDLRSSQRKRIRSVIEETGLEFVGLHWLLVAPEELHLTTPDRNIRERSWDYMKYLIELCADLGGGVMVLGSGKKRNVVGTIPEIAWSYLQEGLQQLAPGVAAVAINESQLLVRSQSASMAEVEDLMGAVVFLAGAASAMVTGTSILVDGGWTAG